MMSEDQSKVPQSTKYGALGALAQNPLAANSNESQQPEPSSNDIATNISKDASKVASENDQEQNGDFDNEDIQKKMNGLINNLHSPSVAPDESNKTSTNAGSQRPQSPFVGQQAQPSSRINSSKITRDDAKQEQNPLNKSSSRKTSPTNQQLVSSRANSAKQELAISTKDRNVSRRSSTADSDNEHLNTSKSSQRDKTKKTQNTDGQDENRTLRRTISAASSTNIPVVDDKSIDSTSVNNTESEQYKRQNTKEKNKDVETNTERKNAALDTSTNESTAQQPSKVAKPMSNQRQPTRLYSPTKEPDSNEDNNPDSQRLTKPSTDNDQSDTEQITTKKERKRRRPKRISRTTQTYECVFRRMQLEPHEELLPTNDTDKNIQTRQSQLCPIKKSFKKHYPIYLSTDAFKIEELSSKKSSQDKRNTSKSSASAENASSQSGRLLILRPIRASRHANAVNLQRISREYAVDLIRNENKRNNSTSAQRNKSNAHEQTNNLPRVQSSTTNVPKNKSDFTKTDDHIYRRKKGGAV